MGLILASGSPRRNEILRTAGYAFEIVPSGADENIAPCAPGDYAAALAEKKAREVLARRPGDVVLGADTVVHLDGRILGKPRDEAQAEQMLAMLSGRVHEVYTGVSVVSQNAHESFYERTAVRFFSLTREEILAYVQTGEPMDKAGAYGIQGRGALLVEGIDGDFFNVMGLPVARLARVLEKRFHIRPR